MSWLSPLHQLASTSPHLPQTLIFLALLLAFFIPQHLATFTTSLSICLTWPLVQNLLLFTTHQPIVALLWIIAWSYALISYTRRNSDSVYLVDFACYQPDDYLKCNFEMSEFFTRSKEGFILPSIEFQNKIFTRSGLGNETYIPPFIFEDRMKAYFEDSWREAEMVMWGCIDELLSKTGVHPKDIGILITNCSLFSPSPSLSAMLVKRYKMRDDINSFHLSGMGCSASVIACTMAKDMLKSHPNEYAMVVSTESITNNWYYGNYKPMLVTNCLFRVGCAAMLLTNKQSEKRNSKYELLHYVRTHKAADDKAYRCAFQKEDVEGMMGVELSKELMGVAADALRTNIVRLGPSILPITEQLHFLFSLMCKSLLKMQVKQYQPDFKLAVEHFCLHAGGRAVIDEIQKNLDLNDHLLEPSRATLHRYGNTSASCLWYVFAYMEAKGRIKKGDKVWMLGLGSGFKCNSAIWRAVGNIPMPKKSPWLDCIHRYPANYMGKP